MPARNKAAESALASRRERTSLQDKKDLPASHVAHLLHRATQEADHRLVMAANALKTSITPRQYVVLLAIAKSQESRQVDLTAETGIDRSTIADLIWRLQRRGLITRKRSRIDARAKLVRLTPAGEDVLRCVQAAYRRAEVGLLSVLPKEIRQPFVTGLELLIRSGRT